MIVPYCLGRLVVPEEKKPPLLLVLWGYVTIWASFELLAVPMIWLQSSFTALVTATGLCDGGLAVAAIWLRRETMRADLRAWMQYLKEERYRLLPLSAYAVIVAVAVLVVYVVKMTHIDADDSDYVVMARDAMERNTLLRTDPNTGFAADAIELKRILSPFPLWIAALSTLLRVTAPTAAHLLVPPLILVLSVTAVWYGLEALLAYDEGDGLSERARKERLWYALLVFVVLVIFGEGSRRSFGSMLLLRAWQGKAVLCAVLMPMLFSELLRMGRAAEDGDGRGMKSGILRCLLLAVASLLTSGMSLVIVPLLFGAFGIVYGCAWILRKLKRGDRHREG